MKSMFKLLLIALTLGLSKTAVAQSIPCPFQPVAMYIQISDSTYRAEQNIATDTVGYCKGISQLMRTSPATVRYRTSWTACAFGDPWRVSPVLYTTMALGMYAANRPPVCIPDLPVSVANSSIALTADSVLVGGTSNITVTAKNTANVKMKPTQSVAVVVGSGGTSTISLTSALTVSASDSLYRGSFTGISAGTPITLAFYVNQQLIGNKFVKVVAPPIDTTAQTWTTCGNVGVMCFWLGTRDFRMLTAAGTSGPIAQITSTRTFGCATYSFQDAGVTVPNGNYTYCQYGNLKTTTVTNNPSMAGLFGQPATWTVPQGSTGYATSRIIGNAGGPVATPGEGSFRTTCSLTKMGTFDPLVFPGQDNVGHLHQFFGNVDISPTSTSTSLMSTGNSTCLGGISNRTAYWFPVVYDGVTGKVQVPKIGVFYYKTGYNAIPSNIKTPPSGLHMIAGNKNATGSQDVPPNYAVQWFCENGTASANGDGTMPSCAVGDEVQMWVAFPQCWDGVNLDSPDHQSHMAYLNYVNPPQRSVCPSTHPYEIPAIQEILHIPVLPGENSRNWRLTSDMYSAATRGGLSAHADWMLAWDLNVFNSFVKQCLNAEKDCLVGLLGDGRVLNYRQ